MGKNIKKKLKNIKNIFWKDVLDAWIFFSDKSPELETNMSMEPLFFNKNILVGRKTIFYKKWFEKNIVFINDVLREDGSFMNLHDFNLIYGINVNFLEYNGLIAAIREWLKNKNMVPLSKVCMP